MAFITNKQEQEKIKIRNFNDFYRDAINQGISIVPFDIFRYVETFDDIELNINDSDINYPVVGLIEKFQNGYGFLISISKYHDIRIQRMILARLFAHSVLHRDYILENRKIEIRDFWKTDEMSRNGNDFASKLLIPKATFLEIIKNGSTIGEVADRFVIPPRFMKYRAYNLGLVKEF